MSAVLERLRRRAGRHGALQYVGFAALYLGLAVAGRATRPAPHAAALVWPAAAAALLWIGAAWRRRHRRWLDICVLGAAALAVNLATAVPARLAVAFAVATVVQTVVACAVLDRMPWWSWRLDSARELSWLLLGVVAGAAAGGVIVRAVLMLDSGRAVLTSSGPWAVRNGASMFVLGALALRATADRSAARHGDAGRVEIAAAWVTTAVLYGVVFGVDHVMPLAFVVLPVNLWVALRASTRMSTLHLLVTSTVAAVATVAGRGVFARSDPTQSVVLAQAFITILAFVTLLLALDADTRQRLIDDLSAAHDRAAAEARRLSTVLDTVSEGITVVDASSDVILHNRSAREMLGNEQAGLADAWVEPTSLRNGSGDPLVTEQLPMIRSLQGEQVRDVDLIVRAGRPDEAVLSVSSNPIREGDRIAGAVAAFRDVTNARREEREVRRTRDLFAAVLEGATEQAIIAVDAGGRITLFNPGAERMLGFDAAALVGHDVLDLVDPRDLPDADADTVSFGSGTARATRRTWRLVAADGHRLVASVSASPMADGTGSILVATDISAEVEATAALRASEAHSQRVFDDAPLGMAVLDLEAATPVFTRVNRAVCTLLGMSSRELVGSRVTSVVHPDDLAAAQTLLAPVAGADLTLEMRLTTPRGGLVWVLASATRLADASTGDSAVLQLMDVTARKAAENSLAHQALHDPLTGLANRSLLEDRLEHAVAASPRGAHRVGVLYIDLDGFKGVNDTVGHAAGDAVLIEAATRLAGCMRPGDTVARVGGDEFVVVCPGLDDGTELAAIARRALETLRRPFTIPQGTFPLSASIGAAASRPGASGADILSDADEALYAAKRAGRNRVATAGNDGRGRTGSAGRLLPQIKAGLDDEQFVVHGQPIVDLRTRDVVAVETLLRWHHPTRGTLPPGDFIAVAESSPLMQQLGTRVLRESCRQAACWLETLGPAAPCVHVNVSARQFGAGSLTNQVLDCLDRYSLPANRLVLELTETHALLLVESLRRDIGALRELGVRIALDDVGTGYSTLSRLTELPVDILKIDRAFVLGLGVDTACTAVVRSLLALGATLGALVVAEGVETPQQEEALERYGCDTVQGFLYSPARPERDLLAFLVTAARRTASRRVAG